VWGHREAVKVEINPVLTKGSDLDATLKSRMDKAALEVRSVKNGAES